MTGVTGVVAHGDRPACCLYEHAWGDRDGGAMLSIWSYGEHYLGESGWSNRASAWENNQTGGALGSVYEDCQISWCYLFGGRAWSAQWFVGTARSDRADIVYLAA